MRYCLRLSLIALLGLVAVAPADAQTEVRALKLINDARSRPRRCGGDTYKAARPLTLNTKLERAARQHSDEMAKYSLMQHEGRDGSTPAQRVTLAGYRWSAVAENVGAGQRTAEEIVAGWLASPGHCENIMNAHYSEMGIASAVNEKDRYGVYWTLTLAAPR